MAGMKLSHPVAIKLVSLLASWFLRAWVGTMDFWFAADDPMGIPSRRKTPAIYLFWHETMLLPAYTHAREGFAVLVSQHRDGELIAQIFRRLGGHAIRGSTTRGGAAALRNMIGNARGLHIAITPDGPRGPRHVVQVGAIYLASRTGMPLVPVGFAFQDPWRARSWDRTALPRPWRPARGIFGKPIEVPGDLDRGGLEACRRRVQAAVEDVQTRAERLARQARPGRGLMSLSQVLRQD